MRRPYATSTGAMLPMHGRSPRAVLRAALLTCLLAIGSLAFPGGPAYAALSHTDVQDEFALEGGPPCVDAFDMAVDEKENYLYVTCRTLEFDFNVFGLGAVVKRYDFDGNPVNFPAPESYVENNVLIRDPNGRAGTFFNGPEIAVDNSATGNQGNIYVTSAPHLEAFKSSGKFALSIVQPQENLVPNELNGVDVDSNGFLYLTTPRPGSRVSKYNEAFQQIKRLYGRAVPGAGGRSLRHIRVDSTGSLWAGHIDVGSGNPATWGVVKYEADQFTDELEAEAFQPNPLGLDRFVGRPSPFTAAPLVSGSGPPPPRFDLDLSDDDLYVNLVDRIRTYSKGNAAEHSFQNAPPFGEGTLTDSRSIAVTDEHYVFASTVTPEGPKIVRFGPGDILPDAHTAGPELEDVGHTEVAANGSVELAGGGNVTECVFEYGTTTNPYPSSVPCSPSSFSEDEDVSANLTGLTVGATYHYRVSATNSDGTNVGIDRTVTPAFVLNVRTLPATVFNEHGADLNASFDPDGIETTYHFEWGPTDAYGFETPSQEGGSGTGDVSVGTEIGPLPGGRTYHYRVIATNANGSTVGPDMTFRTASAPDISGVRTTDIEPTAALLHAEVNPVGYATKYHFEYGPTVEYGQMAPAESTDVGTGTEPVEVTQQLAGLRPGVTYHYRVLAENEWGVTYSADTTFDYAPPGCPNDFVRQQTLSSYLPDCRAYELVSPAFAGAIVLRPSDPYMHRAELNPAYSERVNYSVNRGFASSPSRFSFFGTLGSVEGIDAPTFGGVPYMATRTNSGWVTTLAGLGGNEATGRGRSECSESLELCIDHSEPVAGAIVGSWGFIGSYAPYLFSAAGQKLGRLPTNLHAIPGGEQFYGAQRMSGDFNHFVFSSNEYNPSGPGGPFPSVAFAPDGVTDPFGSAYDNDVGARTVTVISKLPNGEDIPQEAARASNERTFDFPGLTPDGSHVLMSTPAGGDLIHLFMRVSQAITYDISQGAAVQFVGMARDGSKVLFITDEQLTEDDSDSSGDLYEWVEDGSETGSLTRVSQGNGEGDSDECNPSWGPSDCSVVAISPERWHPNKNTALSAPGQDDIMAERSGDVYFYSPEVLDPSRSGLKNERNLYLYRDGAVQLVAALEEDDPVKRMQISANGRLAAILTASRLTSFDNTDVFTGEGDDMVYVYDADARVIRCASCSTFGLRPNEDVRVSQGGRFMSDDGRAFFATGDDLVPRDQDGGKIDVYEFVGGRPQLITTGLAARDYTGGTNVASPISLEAAFIGLEHVSRDGVDVIFNTFESILPEDRNGNFIKFYNARTGGGFAREPDLGPCLAADECHGPDSSRFAPGTVNTAKDLGTGGNVAPRVNRRRCGKGKVRRKGRCRSRRVLVRRACRSKSGRARRRCVRRRSAKLRRLEAKQRRLARAHHNGRRVR